MDTKTEDKSWSSLTHEEKNRELFLRQEHLLDLFLVGAHIAAFLLKEGLHLHVLFLQDADPADDHPADKFVDIEIRNGQGHLIVFHPGKVQQA